MTPFTIEDFVRESNRIEGIDREPMQAEIEAHMTFLHSAAWLVDLEEFVTIICGARLRRFEGMNVRVGRHIAPPGGAGVVRELTHILRCANAKTETPHTTHQRYEHLHPFMDGNGRSGRVLWLWMMGGIEKAPLGFLHHFYYQSLDGYRRERG